MQDRFVTIALTRKGVIPVRSGASSTPNLLAAAIVELGRLGVRITNPELLNDSLLENWTSIHTAAVKLRGADKNYSPLFKNFPDALPDYDDAFFRFGVASLRLHSTLTVDDILEKEFAGFTDAQIRNAMDFSDLGWWPASSVPLDPDQTLLDEAAQAVLPADTHTQWIDLTIVAEDSVSTVLGDFVDDCASSTSSLNAGVLDDLRFLISSGISPFIGLDEMPFREIRSIFLTELFPRAVAKDGAALHTLTTGAVSPDDILRVLAALAGSDVSLGTKVTFPKLSRSQRRVVLAILDCSSFITDVWRRPRLWIVLAKSLHVGEYAAKYPRAFAALDTLRTNRRNANSPLSVFERHLTANDVSSAVLSLDSPATAGILLRQLRRLASLSTSTHERSTLLDALGRACATASLGRLLDLRSVIVDNGATYPRLAITKSGTLLTLNNEPGHLSIDRNFLKDILVTIDFGITEAARAKPSWDQERLWVDPALSNILVPSQLRSTSDTRISVERGSRLPVGTGQTLRLFVHWMQAPGDRSDLDLSCIMLNDDFSYRDHVSYTNLATIGGVHSGDITSAPAPTGATEFIDLDLAKLEAAPGRYVVPVVLRYSGSNFAGLDEAFAGWMIRDDATHGRKSFDPSTVASAFDLTGTRTIAIPFVYDTKARQIIYLDGFCGHDDLYSQTVEGSGGYIADLARGLVARTALRANLADLALINGSNRGATLELHRERATLTIGLDDQCDYNVLRPETVLADLT
jgi:stress response protein SCP2